ncbi:YkgJ family cysteine cluster protein [Methanococcus maripaludis]|uniref:Flagellin N-methylase n=1 Tax=Methanococcus maripaludis TaxID=39152 RepID=A0A2L1CCP9_METMI|nr:YkgJ family cysteine cluster protein [Methanococcus maripaludis]AVB77099.1 Flagellin N-methylase [Methanococcus maripaludis]MBA2863611.1 hypothetical protein [Methanococcus maripaludis]MBB6496383.1 hypothetical protein [Methanococcus maripaludis]
MKIDIKKDLKNIAWHCRMCGGCCDSPSVSKKDVANIAGFLKIPFDEVVKKYLVNFDGMTGRLKTSKEKCIFLDENNKCKIYRVRPIICRLRPYSVQIKDKNLVLTYDGWFLENCKGLFMGDLDPDEEYYKHAETVLKYLGEEENTPEEFFEKAKKRLKKSKKIEK